MRAVCILALSAALAGCGGSAPLFARDGRPTTLVQCSAQGPLSACTENARGMCEGDFDIVKQSADNGVRNLLFACRPH
ncbi:MAG: hypothetical protein QOI13_2685 [Paraburkholderia sp.]|nr:hypothetical protein [Paraburkholderia sp.]